jgi:hypothetical protein
MAKPSVTNIRPPTTPPKTQWDLNSASDQADSHYQLNTGSSADGFDILAASINIPLHGPTFNFNDYNYVFFGVNGGADETVIGNNTLSGVIVTGNGKDHITGGQYDDIVFSGNGSDVIHGAGGNDIIYGENGPDQLFGDGDEGTATYIPATTSTIEFGDAFVWNHNPTDDNGSNPLPDHGQRNYQAQQEGFWVDGNDHIWRVFSFANPDDADQVVTYEQSSQINGDGNVVSGSFTALAGQTTYFLVDDSSLDDQGRIEITFDDLDGSVPNLGSDVTFERNHISLELGNTDPGEFEFTAGDQLIGGNGPDRFVWNANDGPNNVDLVWDFNQGSGGYDPTEGDILVLQNTGVSDVGDLVTTADHDLNGDGNNDLLVYFSENHAIGFVGITDISQLSVQFMVTA